MKCLAQVTENNVHQLDTLETADKAWAMKWGRFVVVNLNKQNHTDKVG